MKLDLLYEIDAPRPWEGGPHPYGQRQREQRAYYEMLDQMRLADEVGFHIAWFVEHHFREGRSHCPAPEVVIHQFVPDVLLDLFIFVEVAQLVFEQHDVSHRERPSRARIARRQYDGVSETSGLGRKR